MIVIFLFGEKYTIVWIVACQQIEKEVMNCVSVCSRVCVCVCMRRYQKEREREAKENSGVNSALRQFLFEHRGAEHFIISINLNFSISFLFGADCVYGIVCWVVCGIVMIVYAMCQLRMSLIPLITVCQGNERINSSSLTT